MDSSRYEIDEATGCWNFIGCKDHKGYGRIRVNYRHWQAHRYSLSLSLGRDILPGKVVMHSCDNPACVNPSHLKEGTQRENMLDCISKGRGGNRGGWNKGFQFVGPATPSHLIKPKNPVLSSADKHAQRVLEAAARGHSAKAIAANFNLRLRWVQNLINSGKCETGRLSDGFMGYS